MRTLTDPKRCSVGMQTHRLYSAIVALCRQKCQCPYATPAERPDRRHWQSTESRVDCANNPPRLRPTTKRASLIALPSATRVKRIEGANAETLKISCVAGDDGQAMHCRGGGDHGVFDQMI